MNCASLTAEPYVLQLRQPLPVSAGGGSVRRGLLVRLTTDTGLSAVGDVVPLPGVSEESLEDALEQVHAVAPHFTAGARCADSPASVLATLGAMPCLYPSVRFGLESAVMHVLSLHGGTPWWQRLGLPWQAQVRVNALVPRLDAVGHAAAMRAVEDGYTCLKIKVGLGAVATEARLLRAWRRDLAPRVRLRLDANRAWSLDDALRFAALLEACGVDYCEEPVRDVGDLPAFRAQSALPLALDESLGLLSVDDAMALRAAAWVIKPTLRGGIGAAVNLADAARRAGARPVISSTFESGVGLRTLAQLAAVVQEVEDAAGLDTGSWIERDLLEPPLHVECGALQMAALRDPVVLRERTL